MQKALPRAQWHCEQSPKQARSPPGPGTNTHLGQPGTRGQWPSPGRCERGRSSCPHPGGWQQAGAVWHWAGRGHGDSQAVAAHPAATPRREWAPLTRHSAAAPSAQHAPSSIVVPPSPWGHLGRERDVGSATASQRGWGHAPVARGGLGSDMTLRRRAQSGVALTLQGQGNNLCCCALIILCHTPVVPHISALAVPIALAPCLTLP